MRPSSSALLLFSLLVACGGGPERTNAPAGNASAAATEEATFKEPAPTSNERWTLEVIDRGATNGGAIGLALSETRAMVSFVPTGADHAIILGGTGNDWGGRLGASNASSQLAYARDPEGNLFAAIGSRGSVKLHQIDKSKTEKVIDTDAAPVALAFDAKGRAHVCLATQKGLKLASRETTSGTWNVTSITEDGSRCSIAADDDGLVHVAFWSKGKAIVATKATGEIQQAVADPNATAAYALRGRDGKAILVLGIDGQLVSARLGNKGWVKTPFGPTLGPIAAIVAENDAKSGVRAIVSVGDRTSRVGGKVALWSVQESAGANGSSILLQTAKPGIAPQIAIDTAGEPHVAFIDDGKVVHARHKAKDDDAPRKMPSETFALGCAGHIEGLASRKPTGDGVRALKEARDCEWVREGIAPTRASVERMCNAKTSPACLLLGTMLAPRGSIGALRVEIRARPCEGKEKKACAPFFESKTEIWPVPDGKEGSADLAAATKAFEAACEGTGGVGCLLRGELAQTDDDAAKFYAKGCSAILPSACEAWLVRGAFAKVAIENSLPHLRTEIAQACEMSSADACNALAFMQERPLGFKRGEADPTKTYLRACELGSALSCARLLLGPGARPQAKIEGETFAASLTERCEAAKDADTCNALATAYEIGWGVPKDAARAKTLYGQACDAGGTTACKKAGR